MNLDELQRIQSKERQTDSVQPLRAEFYEEVGEYVQGLRDERERVAEEQGFDAPEFRQLSDEIDAAEDTVESLYERRVGKIVKAASFAAAGMPAEDEGLTDEEQRLFDRLVADIEQNREHVLDVLAGEAVPGDAGATTDPSDEPSTVTDSGPNNDALAPRDEQSPPTPDPDPEPSTSEADAPGVDAADLMGDDAPVDRSSSSDDTIPEETDETPEPRATEPEGLADSGIAPGEEPDTEQPPSTAPDTGSSVAEPPDERDSVDSGVDRSMVRITRDVGEILGVDERAYDLGEDDVVTLPEANAEPLVERDAAERLE